MVFDDWTPIYDGLCHLHKETPSDLTRALYFQSLHRFSPAQVRQAVRQCTEEIKWFPKIAELLEAIPTKRVNVDDIDREAGVERGFMDAKTKHDVSAFDDDYIMDVLKERFDWTDQQAMHMLKLARKDNKYVCEEFWVGHEQRQTNAVQQNA